jgi:hypothetical protein
LGVSRNTVRAEIASDTAPKYDRKPVGSIVDAAEVKIREQAAHDYASNTPTAPPDRLHWITTPTHLTRESGCTPQQALSSASDTVPYG